MSEFTYDWILFPSGKKYYYRRGGVITTNDSEVYKQLCRLRSHGIIKGNDPFLNKDEGMTNGIVNPWYYEMRQLGYNYRITDVQCSLGISQLAKVDFFIKRRREIAFKYDESFKDLNNATLLQQETRALSANHLYLLGVKFNLLRKTKNELFQDFRKKGINLHVHYIPIPMQPYYQENYPHDVESYKVALDFYRNCVTLPLYPSLSDMDVEQVINAVRELIL